MIHTAQGNSCTSLQYDHHKKPIKITQPNGAATHFFYRYDYQNEYGQTVYLEEEIDPNGNVTTRIMDACGRLAREERKDSFGNIVKRTTFIHDGEGNLIQRKEDNISSGNQIVTEFQYDARNRQIAIIEAANDPLQKITRTEYNLTGELAKVIKPNGVFLNCTYDLLGRLADLYSSDGSIHYIYSYDLNGNIIKVDDLIHQNNIQRIFDQNNRMILENYGLQFTYQYDPLGRVTNCTLPDQTTVLYQYNAMHLTAVSRNNHAVLYQHELSGRLSQSHIPNDLGTITYTYDTCLRPQKIASPYWTQHILYDPSGNVSQIDQTDIGNCHCPFSYDPLDHLISEPGHTYAFDSLQNRIRKNDTPYTINSLNQLKQQSHHTYHHDPNGNLIKKTEISYQYDALDRLIAIHFPDKKIEYTYDSFHRRLTKTTHQNATTEKILYAYQGEIEVGTYQAGKALETRIIGQGKRDIGATVFIEIQGQTFIPLHDYRGNIVALLDLNNKNVREYYRYTAYGEEQILNSQGTPLSHSINPWRFSSKRTDAETHWVYFGRRYYDPEIGRWTTPDPLGFQDGFNLYCFVKNRPLLFVDPDGRSCFGSIGNYYEHFMNTLTDSCVKAYNEGEECPEPRFSRVYKVGEKRHDNFMLTVENGMSTPFHKFKAQIDKLSADMGGCEVVGIYNASFGIFDLFEAAAGLLFGFETTPNFLKKEVYDDFFERNPNGMIIHRGHSQGGINQRNFLISYDPEKRKQVFNILVAPAAHIDADICGGAIHLESTRDFVPLFDYCLRTIKIAGLFFLASEFDDATLEYLMTQTCNTGAIMRLDPHPDAPWFDHDLDSPTYEKLIDEYILKYINQSGSSI